MRKPGPVTVEDMPVLVECPKCGGTAKLYFNGGELDSWFCCGIYFEIRATGFELVITKP